MTTFRREAFFDCPALPLVGALVGLIAVVNVTFSMLMDHVDAFLALIVALEVA